MINPVHHGAAVRRFAVHSATAAMLLFAALPAGAAGTAAGTIIENTATVDFNLNGSDLTLSSNTTTITVAERIDVVVTLQSPQVLVAANDVNRALLFTVTNTGNGSEAFALAIDSVLAGDDFDPQPSSTSIYFDTDGSGDLNAGDQPYSPGSEPLLAPDASVDVFLVNDIPGTVQNGDIGFSQLTAVTVLGANPPGTVYGGAGDGGVDAVIGATGGSASETGEYLVSDVQIAVIKSQAVSDPWGGAQPVPGATITYTVTIEVTSTGTATGAVFNDPIPTFSTYVPNSITLNGSLITDATDADAGEFDTSVVPAVVVRLGDLTSADGVQTVEFDVTID